MYTYKIYNIYEYTSEKWKFSYSNINKIVVIKMQMTVNFFLNISHRVIYETWNLKIK